MAEPRKLSECYPSMFAICTSCGEIFIDDLPPTGPLTCPTCHWALKRRITRGMADETLKAMCRQKLVDDTKTQDCMQYTYTTVPGYTAKTGKL